MSLEGSQTGGGAAWRFERAAIIGAGSMGTLLAAVLGGRMPVVLVSRSAERAGELFEHGAVSRGLIEASATPIVVRSIPAIFDAGGASVVFVATKTTAIPSVARELGPCLRARRGAGERVYVVSFQNGIDPGRALMEQLRHPDVLRMVLGLGTSVDEDGSCVRVSLNQPAHAIGCVDSSLEEPCRVIARELTAGGLETALSEDIEAAVWRKAIVNAAMNPVAALANCTVGEVLDAPARCIFERLMEEGQAVAAADGIALPGDYPERAAALVESARDHLPSMVLDIRRNRESEVGQLNRQIMEHGRRLGVATPTHEVVDALIETFDWKVYHRRARDGG